MCSISIPSPFVDNYKHVRMPRQLPFLRNYPRSACRSHFAWHHGGGLIITPSSGRLGGCHLVF
jgi:hypothetical protein